MKQDKTLNETHGPLTIKVKIEKVATDLEKLEIGLQKARAAIKEAKHTNLTYYDPDFKPVGPIYWNSNAFQRYVKRLTHSQFPYLLLFISRKSQKR